GTPPAEIEHLRQRDLAGRHRRTDGLRHGSRSYEGTARRSTGLRHTRRHRARGGPAAAGPAPAGSSLRRSLQCGPSSANISKMQAAERLIVALDVNSRDSALSLVQALRPRVQRFKVGLELFTACGPALVREILDKGGQVFLDLKFHDIPSTVARAAVSAARLGVGMFTIHLSGGPLMARRAADELEAHCQVYRVQRPNILGVKVLTSLSLADLEELGVGR